MIRFAAILALLPFTAVAGPYDGFCFAGGPCTGPIEIRDNGFDQCERTCVMENPVEVRGLRASLYDVTCRGDIRLIYERMMFLWVGEGHETQLVAITDDRIETLTRCR